MFVTVLFLLLLNKRIKDMKRIREIVVVLFVFVFVLCDSVSANGMGGSIIIDNAIDGKMYTIYKMLDLESFDGDNYSYKISSSEWDEFFYSGDGRFYFDVNSNGGVAFVGDEQSMDLVSQRALAYAKSHESITKKSQRAVGNVVEFKDLDLGYYLVDSSVGVLCGLTTTNYVVRVEEKNEKPTLSKYVKMDGTDSLGKYATAGIGDVVYFTSVIKNFKGAENLELTDVMEKGLSLNLDSIVVSLVNDNLIIDLNENEHYSVLDLGNGFEVLFTFDGYRILENHCMDCDISISYSAIVNKDACTNNANVASLKYGDHLVSLSDKVNVGVLSIPVFKCSVNRVGLEGAEFSLYTSEVDALNDVNCIRFIETKDSNVFQKSDLGQGLIKTDRSGRFVLSGLKSGRYFLREVQAPRGYNKLSDVVTVVVNPVVGSSNEIMGQSLLVFYGMNMGKAEVEVEVQNQSGSLLPSTGSVGTWSIYLIGFVFVLVSFVLYRKFND